MSHKKYVLAVALAAIAVTLTACNNSSSTPQPPPVPPAPTPSPTTPPTSVLGVTSVCYYTVDGIGDGVSMQVYDGTADCTAAAAAFGAQVDSRYSVSPADDSVNDGWTLCSGTISDSSGTYQVYIDASPSTGIQGAVGSDDPVCTQLGWS